jgi:hypothetical protein
MEVRKMTIWGFIFMAVSWGTIIFILIFTFSKILGNEPGKGKDV